MVLWLLLSISEVALPEEVSLVSEDVLLMLDIMLPMPKVMGLLPFLVHTMFTVNIVLTLSGMSISQVMLRELPARCV